jgi:hypothetical protein
MIIKTLIDFLGDELPFYVGVVAPRETAGYVLLDQTGSRNYNHITTTTIAIQSYGATLLDAINMNEQVKEAMEKLTELNEVSAVRLDTDYNFTNTATKQYRWQAVYEITHY